MYMLSRISIKRSNNPFQRTRATKRLGVFGFRGVARGAERKR